MESIKKQLKDSLDSMDATYTIRQFRSAIMLLITSDHTTNEIGTLKSLCDEYNFESMSFGDIDSLIFRESTILISTKASEDKLFQSLGYSPISICSTELLTTNDK